jgi:hypothetical protein
MSPEYNFAMEAMKAIANWAASFVNWKRGVDVQKQAQADIALTSLMAAVTQTRHYLATLRNHPEGRNPDRQAALVALWSEAGRHMLPIEPNLAGAYLLKADYWSDPEGWTLQQKDEQIIELDRVFTLGQRALHIQPDLLTDDMSS